MFEKLLYQKNGSKHKNGSKVTFCEHADVSTFDCSPLCVPLFSHFRAKRCDWSKKVTLDPFLCFDPFSLTKLFATIRTCSKRYLNSRKSVLDSLADFIKSTSCLDVVKEEKPRPRPRPDLSELDFSSLLDVSIVSFARDTTLTESAQELQSTWLPSSSTCPLKSWSWLVTLPVTTRKQESYPDIFNLPSATMKS